MEQLQSWPNNQWADISRDFYYYQQYYTLGLETTSSNGFSVKIYPNPSSDIINVGLGKEWTGKINLKIYNTLGQVVWQENQNINTDVIRLSLSSLPKGSYFLQVQQGKAQQVVSVQLY